MLPSKRYVRFLIVSHVCTAYPRLVGKGSLRRRFFGDGMSRPSRRSTLFHLHAVRCCAWKTECICRRSGVAGFCRLSSGRRVGRRPQRTGRRPQLPLVPRWPCRFFPRHHRLRVRDQIAALCQDKDVNSYIDQFTELMTKIPKIWEKDTFHCTFWISLLMLARGCETQFHAYDMIKKRGGVGGLGGTGTCLSGRTLQIPFQKSWILRHSVRSRAKFSESCIRDVRG